LASSLLEKLERRSPDICLYGLAPPKLATEPGRLAEIASQHQSRLGDLKPDGLIVYDLQDEPGRIDGPRPFPFLPTIPPDTYARQHLAALDFPKIVYRSVRGRSVPTFNDWLVEVAEQPEPSFSVLVGAPTAGGPPGMSLNDAYTLVAQRAPQVILGGIAIAERHGRKLDEHLRMMRKTEQGCRFFVTQAVYDSSSTMSLLSDYALGLKAQGKSPVPIILTFSPCGSPKTLELMKWLGVSFPRWLENDLRHSGDILDRSVLQCQRVFQEVREFARDKGLPLGINVESVSIRRAEVEASIALFRALRAAIDPAL
jgi:hypothetical protein